MIVLTDTPLRRVVVYPDGDWWQLEMWHRRAVSETWEQKIIRLTSAELVRLKTGEDT